MKRIAVVIAAACSSAPAPAPGPTLAAPAEASAPVTTCYQGVSSGAGQRVQTVSRRTVDRANRQIVEDVARGDAGDVKAFHVVSKVDGNAFTMAEAGGAFTGSGTLTGPAWQWTSWVSRSAQQLGGASLEVESHDELTATGRIAHKEIRRDGAVVATAIDELTTFDCAGWDAARAALAVPALDDALCDRACRRFATIKFAIGAEAEITKLPEAERDAARRKKADELRGKLDAAAPACITQCRAANNAVQTACLARATSPEQLDACDAK